MAEIILDLRNYKDRSGSRIPEGTYKVSIEDIEVGNSKAGATMLTVFLRVVGGPEDGATLIDRLTMSDKAMFRVVAFLNALGVKTPKKQIRIDPARYVGRKLNVNVSDAEPYEGKVRSQIDAYIRIQADAANDDLLDEDADESAETEEAPKVKKSKKAEEAPAAPDTLDDADLDLDDIDLG